jgi:hypothetical protein
MSASLEHDLHRERAMVSRKFVVSLAAIAITLAVPGTAAATEREKPGEEVCTYVVTVAGGLNFRKGYTTAAEIAYRLPQGARFEAYKTEVWSHYGEPWRMVEWHPDWTAGGVFHYDGGSYTARVNSIPCYYT